MTAAPGPNTRTEVATGAAGLGRVVATAQIAEVRPGEAERPHHSLAVVGAVQVTAVTAGDTEVATARHAKGQAPLHTLTLHH